MEKLPKRVNEWLNRVFESLGADPETVDEILEEYKLSQFAEKDIKIFVAQSENGLCRSVQELLFSEKEDSDFKRIDLVEGLEETLPLILGSRQRICALVSIKRALEYYYANPHILEIGIAKDDAAIAAADLKRQRKADRLRKQMKVAS
jgi:hypothetical protein